ncbi:MAG: hypothetical protein ACRDHZ_08200, partial [Ktedonobacteraceae bacterium]
STLTPVLRGKRASMKADQPCTSNLMLRTLTSFPIRMPEYNVQPSLAPYPAVQQAALTYQPGSYNQ